MNYASVFLAFILVASAFFWYIGGRRYYTGPLIEAQVGEGSESDDRVSMGVEGKSEKENTIV